MSNRRQLSKDTQDANRSRSKPNPFGKDVHFDPEGQWKYPGQVTKIPSGDITMKGVDYPVYGIDDQGNEQMMYPGQDYQFPGNVVTEYPMMQNGGDSDEFEEMELDDNQIEYYKSLGYRIEELE